MLNNNFSFQYYKQIFEIYNSSIRVCDYKKHDKGIIVRHDIDWDITKAYEFSILEKSIGITSTYYVMLTSEIYNIFSPSNVKMLNTMIDNGFEIGLHFDPMLYTNHSEDLSYYFNKEIALFESFFGIKIKSYSMHQPSVHGEYLKTDLIDAYHTDIFHTDFYISDSCFNFRGKNPIEFLKKSDSRLVQFLTHPSQWSEDGNLSYNNFINFKINDYKNKLFNVYEYNYTFNEQKKDYILKFENE